MYLSLCYVILVLLRLSHGLTQSFPMVYHLPFRHLRSHYIINDPVLMALRRSDYPTTLPYDHVRVHELVVYFARLKEGWHINLRSLYHHLIQIRMIRSRPEHIVYILSCLSLYMLS